MTAHQKNSILKFSKNAGYLILAYGLSKLISLVYVRQTGMTSEWQHYVFHIIFAAILAWFVFKGRRWAISTGAVICTLIALQNIFANIYYFGTFSSVESRRHGAMFLLLLETIALITAVIYLIIVRYKLGVLQKEILMRKI